LNKEAATREGKVGWNEIRIREESPWVVQPKGLSVPPLKQGYILATLVWNWVKGYLFLTLIEGIHLFIAP